MAAAQYAISINQGETYTKKFVWCDSSENPRDLTGYTPRFQARSSPSQPATFLDSATTTGLSITIPTPSNAEVLLSMTAVCTASIPCEGVYAIELFTAGGVVKRLVEGPVDLSTENAR
jgi:hypothetical protein